MPEQLSFKKPRLFFGLFGVRRTSAGVSFLRNNTIKVLVLTDKKVARKRREHRISKCCILMKTHLTLIRLWCLAEVLLFLSFCQHKIRSKHIRLAGHLYPNKHHPKILRGQKFQISAHPIYYISEVCIH